MSRLDGAAGNDQDGFVLIEALLAIGILAVALVLVNSAFASVWRSQHLGERESTALSMARGLLNEVGVVTPLAEGESAGVENGYAWRIEIVRHAAGRELPAPARVPAWWATVEISWAVTPQGSGTSANSALRRLSLTTLKLTRPAP